MTRFFPVIAFTSDDLPTFGRPMIAILIGVSSASSAFCAPDFLRNELICPQICPNPRRCDTDAAIGSQSPRERSSWVWIAR